MSRFLAIVRCFLIARLLIAGCLSILSRRRLVMLTRVFGRSVQAVQQSLIESVGALRRVLFASVVDSGFFIRNILGRRVFCGSLFARAIFTRGTFAGTILG
jgi:hypothetical protein